jgi:N-formylglutamate deformylase
MEITPTAARCAEAPGAITLDQPTVQAAPLIVASPHSGRDYPAEFLAASRLPPFSLRKTEDCFVDELFAAAPGLGVPLLTANFPRAFCDVNREAWELDPAMFEDALPPHINHASPRVAAGLGTIAKLVGSGEPIYRQKLRFAEAQTRIATCWTPYHHTLQTMIERTIAQFGYCLLIDAHSMPTPLAPASRPPDIVLGDAHGAACHRDIVTHVEIALRHEGFLVRRNDPYAGGYITRHYGRPADDVHVLQIEIARALYLDEARIERLPGFAAVQRQITSLIAAISLQVHDLIG